MNAAVGFHDDMIMSRAIGLYISSTLPMPRLIERNTSSANNRVINESTI